MFRKILIANRGEIAVRIIRACKEMGIITVAVFSEADSEALHVSLADESYCIGPAPAAQSYLNMNAVISAALCSGAEAIHPGYGLLSENAEFAAMCRENGLVFIGPAPEVIAAMGRKDEARRLMRSRSIPVVEGKENIASSDEAEKAASELGCPVMLKASAGGGGRGIRIANTPVEAAELFTAASSEAEKAFGDGAMYMEKYLPDVKHIEVQLIRDDYGETVCLGDRDCSIQRRNQKLIEECPAPTVGDELRARLYSDAAAAAEAVNYTGVGTVEFLVRGDEHFFMEMNTRLQVEHSVTEMAVGIDIVVWQIRVAAGYRLSFAQRDICCSARAIECRINAENHRENFAPCPGTVTLLHIPGGFNVRFDTALYQNYTIPPYYDSLIGKMIVCARTREEAIRKMRCALAELVIVGVEHTGGLLLDILSDDAFSDGSYTTGFLKNL